MIRYSGIPKFGPKYLALSKYRYNKMIIVIICFIITH